ncbi:MAG: acetyl-CoA acetyltransferase [Thalassobaculales bacterium]
MTAPVYILGGAQSDFAANWARQGKDIFAAFRDILLEGLQATGLEPAQVKTGHVANFVGDLFNGQGQLGGFFAMVDPGFDGLPAARHEAACASGSVAVLAAAAEIEAGRYDLAAVVGIEQMRNIPGDQAAMNLNAAAWVGHECQGVRFAWPHLFGRLGEAYAARYGLNYDHLMAIARNNFANARRNPKAQTRAWTFSERSFTADDEANPVIDGMIRKQDCGQVTDGAAVVFLAGEGTAQAWAADRGLSLEDLPRILGWGHTTAPMDFAAKLARAGNSPYVMPHLRKAITDAQARAGLPGIEAIDVIETHDCFTTTEYMAIDHFGLTPPGQSWRAIEDGTITRDGALPVNPSGGLIGLGHPVGATGVRMLLDAANQATGRAGPCQVEGARRVQTLNVGGSATTVVSFVVGRG